MPRAPWTLELSPPGEAAEHVHPMNRLWQVAPAEERVLLSVTDALGDDEAAAHLLDEVDFGPPRAAVPLLCECDLCASLRTFLGSNERELAWPLSAERRQHVTDSLRGA